MKYALISDIHGNYPALEAVLADAGQEKIKHFIFLGDYINDFHYPNEVIEAIIGLENADVIIGNKDEYLLEMAGGERENWVYEQFAAAYWTIRELKRENMEYLKRLKPSLTVEAGDITRIFAAHSSSAFLKEKESGIFRSDTFAEKYKEALFSREYFLCMIGDAFQNSESLMKSVRELKEGIYVFGHSHMQWHKEIDGKLFVNPGSCGVALDGDTRVSYTILDIENGYVKIDEKKVLYDIKKTINELRTSELYKQAPVWLDLISETMRTGIEQRSFFFDLVNEIASKDGNNEFPYPNFYWRRAAEIWRENHPAK